MTRVTEQSDNKGSNNHGADQSPIGFWHLTRDLLSFQVRLLLDGVRDLLLSPVSVIAALVGVVRHPDQPDYYFRRLLKMGQKSDRWINLFGAHKDEANRTFIQLGEAKTQPSSDDYVRRLESLIITQYEKGGIIKGLKDGTDDLVRKIQKRRGESSP